MKTDLPETTFTSISDKNENHTTEHLQNHTTEQLQNHTTEQLQNPIKKIWKESKAIPITHKYTTADIPGSVEALQ